MYVYPSAASLSKGGHPGPNGSLQAQSAVKSNALLKSVANPQGQLVQDNSGNMPAALQQIQARTVSLGATQKSLPMDPSSIYGQAILQSKFRLSSAGLNQGITGLPLKGNQTITTEFWCTNAEPNLQTQISSFWHLNSTTTEPSPLGPTSATRTSNTDVTHLLSAWRI
ncbi:hypothetical protein PS2_028024 [Malus domestica]